ncbi:MAG: hypothetical protein J6S67_09995 [Methanobrevibacter sp.]|nr:hypothetical protein [Methanobrevibacter sp.]
MGANLEITETGIVSPTTNEIKEEVQSIFTNAFGTDLSLDDATPQGVLIDNLAQLKQASNSVMLNLANQFSPNTASGIFQDALGTLYGMTRKPATYSIVMCRCYGVDGTVLNGVPDSNYPTRVPAMAQSSNGDIFECVVGGIIGTPVTTGGVTTYTTPGYVDLAFRSAQTGEIPCAANTVNSIYQAITGWDSVNNIASGTVGEEQESRAAFENRRLASLSLQATGSVGAVQAGIANLTNITDYKLWENVTDSSVTTKGVTLSPHSIWICVNSAVSSNDIAKVIYENKSAGCDTNGSVACSYTDPMTGITYSYYYDNPTDVDTYVKVICQAAPSSGISLQIKQAVWDNFNGADDSKAITIGDTVYAGRFFSALAGLDVDIVQIQVSKSSDSGYANYLDFDMDELPVLGDRPTSDTSPSNIIIEVAS